MVFFSLLSDRGLCGIYIVIHRVQKTEITLQGVLLNELQNQTAFMMTLCKMGLVVKVADSNKEWKL